MLLLVTPMRGLWAPDEPDFAQCVREMREGGHWLLPYLNGEPYNEKPILFYWLMKGFAILCDKLTGGLGFTNGISAWSLRLPSVLSAALFVWAFRKWTARFVNGKAAEYSAIVLVTTPIWIWQAQFIQIDMLFAALLAWSWLAWLSGYLLLRGGANPTSPHESRTWFLIAYISLSFAFLAKGPLALVLSVAVIGAFLVWQRDWKALTQMHLAWGMAIMLLTISPWYIAASVKGGAVYAYNMIIYQNFERALNAWDHIQPWWRYANYILGDLFPWVLLLPHMVIFYLRNQNPDKDEKQVGPLRRFLCLATLAPVLLLSCSQSKQGKYVLMIYPFVALLLGNLLYKLCENIDQIIKFRRISKNIGAFFAGLFVTAGLAMIAVAFFGAGGQKLHSNIAPYLGPIKLVSLALVLGATLLARGAVKGSMANFARDIGITVGLSVLVIGTWGFRQLEPHKGYRLWTEAVKPIIAGRRVHFWLTIRSGAMIYTDNLTMHELRDAAQLEHLPAGSLLVATMREWRTDNGGLDDNHRAMFGRLVQMPVGGGGLMLTQKMASDGHSREWEENRVRGGGESIAPDGSARGTF